MHPWLTIDYGAVSTRAVLVWPSGASTNLTFDGSDELSSAVHVDGDDIVVGAAAWQKAITDPRGFIACPLRAAPGHLVVADRTVESGDLTTATLRRVAAEATRLAGEPVDDVRMVIPAGWGPRRRTWLRHAARKAGLTVSRLIEAPIAATSPPTTATTPTAGDHTMLVIDLGSGCEATVLAQTPTGPDVLSTLTDPDAGGDHIDGTLTAILTGTAPDDLPAEQRWPITATVRAARHALTGQAAVTVPLPAPAPPAILNTGHLQQAAQPAFERAAQCAAEALTNADLTPADVAEHTYLIGAAATMPGAAEMIAAKLGITAQVLAPPHRAAVNGAGGADPNTATPNTTTNRAGPPLPPLRRLIGLSLPGVASLALFAHFVLTAEPINGTPQRPAAYYYVLAVWGELTIAAVFAVIAFLQAGTLIAALIDHREPRTTPGTPPDNRITSGLVIAVASGLATTVLYALTAAAYFAYPVDTLLRWSLLPIVPIAAIAASTAALTWHRRTAPADGWDGFLTFPAGSMIAAGLGITALTLSWHIGLPWWLNGWGGAVRYAGGLLIGIAVAYTLVSHPAARLALSLPLGFCIMIISQTGPGIPAVLYAVAVAAWWAHRTWRLARTPPTTATTGRPR
jgi:hypothetical protein